MHRFTPDLLPSDITGSEIYYGDGGKSEFRFKEGPVFANLLLADEVNRAPAKVQAALLEATEERQVTVAGSMHAQVGYVDAASEAKIVQLVRQEEQPTADGRSAAADPKVA